MAGANKVTASAALSETALVQHEELAQEIARNGMVLLENRGALPLTSTDRVVGNSLGQIVYGGSGSGLVSSSRRHISYSDALKEAAQKNLIASYTDDIRGDGNKCIIFISRASQEDTDISASSFNLSSAEKSRLTEACGTFGAENVIVVLNVGSVMDTTYLKNLNLGAIVLAYYGGNTAGAALADCLTGQSNFSGKTVDTWAASYTDYPSAAVGEFGVQNNVQYTEDVYVGYRYFSTFDPNYEKVNYPFGYGLSYTQFTLGARESNERRRCRGQRGRTALLSIARIRTNRREKRLFRRARARAGRFSKNPFAETERKRNGQYQIFRERYGGIRRYGKNRDGYLSITCG